MRRTLARTFILKLVAATDHAFGRKQGVKWEVSQYRDAGEAFTRGCIVTAVF
jgi:hypothetical protein